MDKRSLLRLLVIAVTLNGCGDGSLTENTVTHSGKVADGYLIGAKTCLDLNDNRKCDANEPYGISDTKGRFTLEALQDQISNASLIAEIVPETIDLDNNQAVGTSYTLRAPAISEFISPVTSVLQSVLEDNPLLTTAKAEDLIKERFGIEKSSSLLTDYIENNDTFVHKTAQKIAVVLSEGIKESQQITDADASDSLDNQDFKNIYGVILKKVIQSADRIRSAPLAEIKSRSESPSEGFFNWNDASDLEQEVQNKELEDSQQLGPAEDIVTQGFHHIEFDHRNCESQNALSPGDIPIPGGNDLADYPLPLGFPLSEDLGNLPVCTPDVQLTSIKAHNGLLKASRLKFDPTAKSWSTELNTLNTKIQLSNIGEWVDVDENNVPITFNSEGTAILNNGVKQQELLLQTADLTGKPLSLTYSGDNEVTGSADNESPEQASYENQIAATAATRVFPQGALAIRRSFKQLNTTYEIPSISCQSNSSQTFNDNCNVVRIPDGSAASSIDANMFFLIASSPTDSQHSFQIGSFKVQLQLTSEQAADFSNISSGPVRFTLIDPLTQSENIETGQWIKRNIHGIDLYTIELPSSTSESASDTRIKTIFFTEQNGYVRRGILSSEGDVQIEDDWFVNNAALDSLTNLLQSL